MRPSLFAAEEREAKLSKLGDPLESLGAHVDFAAMADAVDRALPRPHRYFGGRPPYPTELMVRLLVLQQLFNLSDEQLEYQVLDRTSFQRFLGLKETDRVPDRNTIWSFREKLVQAGLGQAIFDEVNRQLQAQGYLARCGQIVDATLVQVPIQRNRRDENEQIKQGETPGDWSEKKVAHKDVDARWTEKHGKQYFGYKLSASTDKRYKLIRKVHISPANEGDQTHLLKVLDIQNTSRNLYASTSSAAPNRVAVSPRHRPSAIDALPASAPAANTPLPGYANWAAKYCAASGCNVPRCNCS